MPDELAFGQRVAYGTYAATVLDIDRRAGRPPRVQIRILAQIERRVRWVRLVELTAENEGAAP